MDVFLKSSIEEYLKNLSRRSMVPGGGSAAALTAAIGAGLNLMVINYSLRPELTEMKKLQEESLKRLSFLIDEDCRAFQRLMEALSLKRKAQAEYVAAAGVPIEICTQAHESMRVSECLLEHANKNLITDVGCAAWIIKAAFYSAELNVNINLKHVEDHFFVKSSQKLLDTMREEIEQAHEKICKYPGLTEQNKM
ncbi:MAG: cyclodeaminase/cyclohydrolase family protein [Candidatus Omnitrophota bacterium]